MAYFISKLQNHVIGNQVYLLDTNVWIFYLKSVLDNVSFSVAFSDDKLPYVRFVEELLDHDSAKIGICLSGFSELINTYLGRVALPSYYESNPRPDKKRMNLKDYRLDTSSDYYFRLQDIKTTLSKKNKFEFLHDNSFVTSFDTLREDFFLQIGMDANDYIYAIAAKSASWVLVTDDADMKFPDVQILTCNNKLLPRT